MTAPTPGRERLGALAGRFRGDLIAPGDAAYDAARRCHNGMIDRHPLVIARPRGASDVAAALGLAREEGMEIAVRGGGHSPAGRSVADGGMVIDLCLMRGVDVDPGARTARVQGGALWADVNDEAGVHGLGVTGGAISTTGVGGYTLGGGLGWLMGVHGLAVDNLVEAEVVLADGEVVRAREGEHDDLFWALRGGGGNFGVVTSFVFRLHPVREVVGGLIAHPIDAAPDLLRFYGEFTADVPDELTVFAGLMHTPDEAAMPIGALLLCHAGPRERAEREIAPLLDWGSPAMAQVAPMPYPAMNTLLDDDFPRGALNYWKSTFVRGVGGDLADAMVERFASTPTRMGGMVLEHFHGAVTRVGPSATAVPHRRRGYNLFIPTVWTDPADTDACIGWTRETYAALEPFRADGRWLNYYDGDEDDQALRDAYGVNAERLAEVKRRYDPRNVLHLNQNIAPAPVAA